MGGTASSPRWGGAVLRRPLPDRVAGLVFIDTIAIPGYVDWFGPEVGDGTAGTIDMERTAEDWQQLGSFGSTPIFVLTQDLRDEDDFALQRFRRLRTS
jgi:hypothetical protein